jgi:hypothetical protein
MKKIITLLTAASFLMTSCFSTRYVSVEPKLKIIVPKIRNLLIIH